MDGSRGSIFRTTTTRGDEVKRRKRLLIVGVISAIALSSVLAALAIARSSEFDFAHSNMTLVTAEQFREFPLYYLGDVHGGVPLKAINRRKWESTAPCANYVSFIYGTCKATSETGCFPPLEVQVWTICDKNLSLYSMTPRAPDGTPPEPFPHERLIVRGVPAALFRTDALEIYAGPVTIAIYGDSRKQLLAAATQLRSLNGLSSIDPGEPLPAPNLSILEGRGC